MGMDEGWDNILLRNITPPPPSPTGHRHPPWKWKFSDLPLESEISKFQLSLNLSGGQKAMILALLSDGVKNRIKKYIENWREYVQTMTMNTCCYVSASILSPLFLTCYVTLYLQILSPPATRHPKPTSKNKKSSP